MLTGTIPASIFEIATIEILYFSNNELTGSIPSSYASAGSLRDLYVNGNQLTGNVPDIEPGQLMALTEFRLESNAITGTMPASVCALVGPDNVTDLVALTADCGGVEPLIQCTCCTACMVAA